jgi:pimeloyl-ACP methyl ester carboxylesterase
LHFAPLVLALPVLIPLVWILGAVAVAALVLGAFWVGAFVLGFVTATAALAAGLALLAVTFLGRFVVLMFKRAGDDEPTEYRTGESERLERPDGTELHVESYGKRDGRAIVLTHGWGSDSTQWYYLKKSLADQFRVVVWDLAGAGRSTMAINGDYSLARMTDDLEAVVKHAGAGAIVVGHSMGGMVALRLLRHAHSNVGAVSGVVLANTTHINPVRTTAAGKLLPALEGPVIRPLLHLTKVAFPLVWLMNWLSYLNGSMHLMLALTGFAGTETRGQLDRVATLGARSHPGVLARQALAMLEHNEIETALSVSAPVLILTADRDRVTIPEASIAMQRKMDGAELVSLSPSGHVSVFERNREFADAVSSFARSHVTG